MTGANGAGLAETFFGMLTDTERRWLRERGTAHTYRTGYLMAVEGKPTSNVTVVVRGLAAAVCATETRAEMLLRAYGPGDIMGIEAILGQQLCPETVQALTECTALVIPVGRFADLHRSAGIARAFGVAMARRVQAADEQARTRLAPPSVRLARALLELAERAGVEKNNGILIPVDLPQQTLATWIAASRATAARTVAELRDQGVINTGYRKITITDPDQLRVIARSTPARTSESSRGADLP